jgi:hypothetical protein
MERAVGVRERIAQSSTGKWLLVDVIEEYNKGFTEILDDRLDGGGGHRKLYTSFTCESKGMG